MAKNLDGTGADPAESAGVPPEIESREAILPPVGFRRGRVWFLDQTLLPTTYQETVCRDLEVLAEAIVSLRIRGAPAIGIAAAFGLLQVTAEYIEEQMGPGDWLGPGDSRAVSAESLAGESTDLIARLVEARERLAMTRPTAVNLFWALGRMARVWEGNPDLGALVERLKREAASIFLEDVDMCRSIGRHGAELLPEGVGVVTHCNAGGLATSGWGTALGIIYQAVAEGKDLHVFVDETRPLLQGARLTAWEMKRRGIPATLLCDNAAAALLRSGRVGAAIVGADRIARNGDTANKIGTYSLAILCKEHGIPFYVAAPTSTIDPGAATGEEIPIEQRAGKEVAHLGTDPTAPEGTDCFNPAFDVTPAGLITAIVTEKGVHRPPFEESLPLS